jgi:hypothetical protein
MAVRAFIVNDLADPMDMLTDDTKFRNLIRYLGADLPAAVPLPVRCYVIYILCQPTEGAARSFLMRSAVRAVASLNELAALACATGCVGQRFVDDRVVPGSELLVFELADAEGAPLGSREAALLGNEGDWGDQAVRERVQAAAHERRTVLAALTTCDTPALASAAALALENMPAAATR